MYNIKMVSFHQALLPLLLVITLLEATGQLPSKCMTPKQLNICFTLFQSLFKFLLE